MNDKISKQTKLWRTRDGKKIRICDMTDQHLINAINFLRRQIDVLRHLADRFADQFDSDTMASYCAENDADYLQTTHADDILSDTTPIFNSLVLEAERRKIDIDEDKP